MQQVKYYQDQITHLSLHQRFMRAYNIFQKAMWERTVIDRLHQAARTIEGLILPDIGKSSRQQFGLRSNLFVQSKNTNLMYDLYEVRGLVEHMHHPYHKNWRSKPQRERDILLLKLAIVAELVGRDCIHRILTREALWPHFRDYNSIRDFWDLSAQERVDLWGEPLDVDAALKAFSPKAVPNSYFTSP